MSQSIEHGAWDELRKLLVSWLSAVIADATEFEVRAPVRWSEDLSVKVHETLVDTWNNGLADLVEHTLRDSVRVQHGDDVAKQLSFEDVWTEPL